MNNFTNEEMKMLKQVLVDAGLKYLYAQRNAQTSENEKYWEERTALITQIISKVCKAELEQEEEDEYWTSVEEEMKSAPSCDVSGICSGESCKYYYTCCMK